MFSFRPISNVDTHAYTQIAQSDSNMLMYVKISSLPPDAEHILYCYSESFKGHKMEIETVLQWSIPFRTLCCRSLNFERTIPSVSETSAEDLFVFRFALSSPLSAASCVMELSCSTPSALTFSPSNTFYFHSDSSLSREFQIYPKIPGKYTITIKPTESCVDKVFNSSFAFEIRTSSEPPKPPILREAAVSNDGSSIILM